MFLFTLYCFDILDGKISETSTRQTTGKMIRKYKKSEVFARKSGKDFASLLLCFKLVWTSTVNRFARTTPKNAVNTHEYKEKWADIYFVSPTCGELMRKMLVV